MDLSGDTEALGIKHKVTGLKEVKKLDSGRLLFFHKNKKISHYTTERLQMI